MKKLLVTGLLLFSIIGFSQGENISVKSEEKLDVKAETEIQIEIDKSVYGIKQNNSYYTEGQESAIQVKLIPMSFDAMKINLQKAEKNVVDKGEAILNGINILFIKKLSDDKETMILIYCKESDKNSSISFISFYPKQKEDYYIPIIEKAFLSAKIKI